VQTTLLSTFRNRSLPLTIGVIANYFGQDNSILAAINSSMSQGKLEVADHGWNHEDFTKLAYAQQLSLLQQAKAKLVAKIPSATVTSFIPPLNTFNNNTLTALKTLGFKYMSSQVSYDVGPYPLYGNALPGIIFEYFKGRIFIGSQRERRLV
jgi:peptidoglycan/xylan/chitin deacetylase (PgdA/CDA1 family)